MLILPSEPLPNDHPFWENSNVTITPHVAAISRPIDIAECFKSNYLLFEEKKALLNCINWKEKY